MADTPTPEEAVDALIEAALLVEDEGEIEDFIKGELATTRAALLALIAADRARLSARDAAIAEAVKALEPFADESDDFNQAYEDYELMWNGTDITIGDLRRARAALDALKALEGTDG